MFTVTCPYRKQLESPLQFISSDQFLLTLGNNEQDPSCRPLFVFNRYSNRWLDPILLPPIGQSLKLLAFCGHRTFVVFAERWGKTDHELEVMSIGLDTILVTFDDDFKTVSTSDPTRLLTVSVNDIAEFQPHFVPDAPWYITINDGQRIALYEILNDTAKEKAVIPASNCKFIHLFNRIFALLQRDGTDFKLLFFDIGTSQLLEMILSGSESLSNSIPAGRSRRYGTRSVRYCHRFFNSTLLVSNMSIRRVWLYELAASPSVTTSEFTLSLTQNINDIVVLPDGETLVFVDTPSEDDVNISFTRLRPPKLSLISLHAIHKNLSKKGRKSLATSAQPNFGYKELVSFICGK